MDGERYMFEQEQKSNMWIGKGCFQWLFYSNSVVPVNAGNPHWLSKLRPDWKYYDLESPDDYQLITRNPCLLFHH
jgi:hypothetical protein